MRKLLLAALCLFSGSLAFSQYSLSRTPEADPLPEGATYSTQLRNELGALRDAALADDYAYRKLAHLTENIGPRPAGSLQSEAAVSYVADELRKLGLEVRLEDVMVPRWTRGEETAQLIEWPGQIGRAH